MIATTFKQRMEKHYDIGNYVAFPDVNTEDFCAAVDFFPYRRMLTQTELVSSLFAVGAVW